MSKYKTGDRVKLGPFNNGEEIIGPELGTILSADEMPWGISYICEVDEDYRTEDDDGLRELTENQIAGYAK